jgi:hypothetical protein
LQDKLVYRENTAQTAPFVQTGADIGIIALSLAFRKELASKGGYVLIPENPNSPLLAIGVSPDCSLRRLSETAGGHLAAAGHQ